MYESLEGRNGSVPEWPKGADCKSVDNVYGGSNPPAPTKKPRIERCEAFVLFRGVAWDYVREKWHAGLFFLYPSKFSVRIQAEYFHMMNGGADHADRGRRI